MKPFEKKSENLSLHSENLYKFCYQKMMLELQISYSENSKGILFLTEHLIFMNILGIHYKKWEKIKLHIDKPP